jgi:integrase
MNAQSPASLPSAPQRVAPADTSQARQRDWFLRDSVWADPVWIFASTSRLEEDHPVRIKWNFVLPSGQRFTDSRYAALLESAKEHLALIRGRSLGHGTAQHPRTVVIYFNDLRTLVRWMDSASLRRFADLNETNILEFTRAVQGRKGRRAHTLTASTLGHHLQLLLYLFRNRHVIADALQVDPFPGQRPYEIARSRVHHRPVPVPCTPKEVAIPLIQGAIEFLTTSAIDLLRARELYVQTIDRARRRNVPEAGLYKNSIRVLQRFTIHTPRGPCRIDSLFAFAALVDMLYAACFVVISYLVGPRMSEIFHLQVGCVHPLPDSDNDPHTSFAIMMGALFKREAAYFGRPHQWIIPPAAVHAIAVLEALSAPHRMRSGRKELFLQPRHRPYGRQWLHDCSFPLQVPNNLWVNQLLNRFGEWLSLPEYEGKPWRLTSHQGRKTFARFVALRDRTSLFALAQHLGHRERGTTDQGYAGTDYALDREIDEGVLEQSLSAWQHMLSVPDLGGRAGSEILAQRPRFQGARMKEDIQHYARMLVDAGLVLGVCEWGFCVYRQEYSACLGSPAGPNPVRREPSTCARCKNFVCSTEHREYWIDQAQRHEALLNDPALPTQTLKIARARLEEARDMLRSIDSSTAARHAKA